MKATLRFVNKESRECYGRKADTVGWHLYLREDRGLSHYVGYQYASLRHLIEDNPGAVECFGNVLFIDSHEERTS